MKKKYVVAVVVVGLMGGGFFWWWNVDGQYRGIQFVSGDPDVSSPAEYERYYEALKRAYADDPYGGTTPEETLQLFIDALKVGDVELASKYFVVEKQWEMRGELEVGKQNNNLDFLISFLEKAMHKAQISDNEFRFTVVEDGFATMSFDLVLNTQTNKWKMSEL